MEEARLWDEQDDIPTYDNVPRPSISYEIYQGAPPQEDPRTKASLQRLLKIITDLEKKSTEAKQNKQTALKKTTPSSEFRQQITQTQLFGENTRSCHTSQETAPSIETDTLPEASPEKNLVPEITPFVQSSLKHTSTFTPVFQDLNLQKKSLVKAIGSFLKPKLLPEQKSNTSYHGPGVMQDSDEFHTADQPGYQNKASSYTFPKGSPKRNPVPEITPLVQSSSKETSNFTPVFQDPELQKKSLAKAIVSFLKPTILPEQKPNTSHHGLGVLQDSDDFNTANQPGYQNEASSSTESALLSVSVGASSSSQDASIPPPANHKQANRQTRTQTATLVTTIGTYQIKQCDVTDLQDRNGWLTDPVINVFFHTLTENPQNEQFASLSSYFYTPIDNRWSNVEEIGVKDLNNVKSLIIPVQTNHHWILLHAGKNTQTIAIYDSIPHSSEYYTSLLPINKQLQIFKEGQWNSIVPQNIPRQTNGIDCGVFISKYAQCITHGEPIKDENFTQVKIDEFRGTMYGILINHRDETVETTNDRQADMNMKANVNTKSVQAKSAKEKFDTKQITCTKDKKQQQTKTTKRQLICDLCKLLVDGSNAKHM